MYSKERDQARRNARKALKLGLIKRSLACEKCGTTIPGGRWNVFQMHHHRGYDKEHELDIQWLCAPCHHQEDLRPKMGYSAAGRLGGLKSTMHHTPESKAKIREYMLGKKLSDETRRKMSESAKRSWANRRRNTDSSP